MSVTKLTDAQRAYRDFLQTAEWKRLREAVMRRDGYMCTACLNAPAVEVHHGTYEHGWLPPAWALYSVCRACHERLDDDGP